MFNIEPTNQDKTRFDLINSVSGHTWGEIKYNNLLQKFTYEQIVTEVSQSQLEFTLKELKELNEDLT
jgi:hypothetical protein